MGQDLGLHLDSSEDSVQWKYSAEELTMRRRVWGVTLILDLFLSLQLSQPSAIVDSHLFSDRMPTVTPSPTLTDTPTAILNLNDINNLLFAHMVSLSHMIFCINLYLFLGFGRDTKSIASGKSTKTLTLLKSELNMWHQVLLVQFRILICHQPMREVIKLNMLYHIAVILLHRPL
jgi:hypothetical protein